MTQNVLSVDLIARIAALEEGLGKAVAANNRAASEITSKWEQSAGVIKGAFGAILAGVSIGALTATFRSTVNAIDALNDFADATGSTVEMGSALEDIALRTGTSMDTVTTAVVKLNSQLREADPNSSVALALKSIGLNAADLRKDDPAQALLKIATALDQFENDGNKARLVQELFGKSVKEVAPFLNDLAEKGSLVATVSKQQAEEAEKLNKQLAALEKHSLDAKRALVSDLVPALNSFADSIRKNGFGGAVLEALGFKDEDFRAPALVARARAVNELARELKDLQDQATSKRNSPDIIGIRGRIPSMCRRNDRRSCPPGLSGHLPPPSVRVTMRVTTSFNRTTPLYLCGLQAIFRYSPSHQEFVQCHALTCKSPKEP